MESSMFFSAQGSLPGKIRELLHTNRKLGKKLAAVLLTATMYKTDYAQRFFNKFDQVSFVLYHFILFAEIC
jgi:hypothetical protein